MMRAPRIPELAQRDRFLKRVASAGVVYAGFGDAGIVTVPSQADRGRACVLLWSSRAEADRWTSVVEPGARVEPISLGRLADALAPAAADARRTFGLDWNIEPVEAEIVPTELVARLQREALESFIGRVRQTRTIWALEDPDGPAVMAAPDNVAQVLLPCWSERAEAERHIGGEWAEAVALEIPIDSFVALTLPWLVEQRWQLAPAPWTGGYGPQIAPTDMAARLSSALVAA